MDNFDLQKIAGGLAKKIGSNAYVLVAICTGNNQDDKWKVGWFGTKPSILSLLDRIKTLINPPYVLTNEKGETMSGERTLDEAVDQANRIVDISHENVIITNVQTGREVIVQPKKASVAAA